MPLGRRAPERQGTREPRLWPSRFGGGESAQAAVLRPRRRPARCVAFVVFGHGRCSLGWTLPQGAHTARNPSWFRSDTCPTIADGLQGRGATRSATQLRTTPSHADVLPNTNLGTGDYPCSSQTMIRGGLLISRFRVRDPQGPPTNLNWKTAPAGDPNRGRFACLQSLCHREPPATRPANAAAASSCNPAATCP